MPGGATGLYLFLLGSAAVFLSAVILVLSGSGAARVGSWAWLIPAWGFAAIALAFGLRRPRGPLVKWVSRIWLAIGALGLLMITFGSRLQFS
jgi:hypothetical protein